MIAAAHMDDYGGDHKCSGHAHDFGDPGHGSGEHDHNYGGRVPDYGEHANSQSYSNLMKL